MSLDWEEALGDRRRDMLGDTEGRNCELAVTSRGVTRILSSWECTNHPQSNVTGKIRINQLEKQASSHQYCPTGASCLPRPIQSTSIPTKESAEYPKSSLIEFIPSQPACVSTRKHPFPCRSPPHQRYRTALPSLTLSLSTLSLSTPLLSKYPLPASSSSSSSSSNISPLSAR